MTTEQKFHRLLNANKLAKILLSTDNKAIHVSADGEWTDPSLDINVKFSIPGLDVGEYEFLQYLQEDLNSVVQESVARVAQRVAFDADRLKTEVMGEIQSL